MRNCVRCGAENAEDALFCAICGFSVEEYGEQPDVVLPSPPADSQSQPGTHDLPKPGYIPRAVPPVAPHNQSFPYPIIVAKNNETAMISMVLGVMGIFTCPRVLSIIAIVLGYRARNEIAASGGWQTGESYAKAGIILGWVGISYFLIIMLIYGIIFITAMVNSSTLLPLLYR